MKSETTVKIKKIVNGGYGITHLPSGQVLLVPHVLPDETVTISIEEIKKNYILGKIAVVNAPHPDRIVPPCEYFGECGGCTLQHSHYSTQLETKKSILDDLLQRQHGLSLHANLKLQTETVASPQQFGYRQRIRLQVNSQEEIGFYRYRSHDLVAVKRCLLAANEINSTLTELRKHPSTKKLTGLADVVEIHLNPGTKKTVIIFHFQRKPRPADIKTARLLCHDINILERIFFSGKDFPINGPHSHDPEQTKSTLTCLYPPTPGVTQILRYSWEVNSFCQVNTAQNWNLIESVLQLCDIQQDDEILDLFCGMGNFSVSLAHRARTLLGIEGQGAAIRSAQKNAAHAGLTNTLFKKGNVYDACQKLTKNRTAFDIVVIDPPRLGVPGLAEHLAQLTKRQLIYISCDPATLCRDLADLSSAGFDILHIQPLDMFPQTHHLETIVKLVKR